jgi:hypothetical protein
MLIEGKEWSNEDSLTELMETGNDFESPDIASPTNPLHLEPDNLLARRISPEVDRSRR